MTDDKKEQPQRPKDITANAYQAMARRTAPEDGDQSSVMLHALLGIISEAGELADQLKRAYYYEETFDAVHWAEEIGDLQWYVALGAGAINLDLATCMMANLQKLAKRYPEKFNQKQAVNRDPEAEKEAVEQELDNTGEESQTKKERPEYPH